MSSLTLIRTAYRRLLKAQRLAFADDHRMQKHARIEIRKHFLNPLPVTPAPSAASSAAPVTDAASLLQLHLQQAEEARLYLLQNVIQAEKKGARYVMNLQERHTVPDPPSKQ